MVNKLATYLNNVDEDVVTNLMLDTKSNVAYFDNMTTSVVTEYTSSLDKVMEEINTYIVSVDNPSIDVMEKYFLELSNCVYFVASKVERLGIYDSMSKAAYKEVYNKAYLDNQIKDIEKKNKTTVAENQAVAENASIYESAVNDIYNKAYKIVKIKLDAAQTMISSLSKIISKRMTENQFSNVNNNTRQILNEEVSSSEWRVF